MEDLDSVLFVMREPSWEGRGGDPRFWNARGAVSRLLDSLYALAMADATFRACAHGTGKWFEPRAPLPLFE